MYGGTVLLTQADALASPNHYGTLDEATADEKNYRLVD
jgi:hypothetical protein